MPARLRSDKILLLQCQRRRGAGEGTKGSADPCLNNESLVSFTAPELQRFNIDDLCSLATNRQAVVCLPPGGVQLLGGLFPYKEPFLSQHLLTAVSPPLNKWHHLAHQPHAALLLPLPFPSHCLHSLFIFLSTKPAINPPDSTKDPFGRDGDG